MTALAPPTWPTPTDTALTRGAQVFLSRRPPARRAPRTLTASATVLDLADKGLQARLTKLRRDWQAQAWVYRDEIGEVRYAQGFLSNIAKRMRLYPALAAPDGVDPTPIAEAEGLPAGFVADALDQVARLASGRVHAGELLGGIADLFSVPGEAMLVGRQLDDGTERWSVHSTDEVRWGDRGWVLVTDPSARDGEPLDPQTAYVARLWRPHPRWSALADSPMRALLDVCEEVLVTGRAIRALLRSRLSAGLLFVPDDLTFSSRQRDDEVGDDEEPEFVQELGETMAAAVADEASPASLVPIILRGPAEAGKALQHLELARTVDPELVGRQDKAIRRLAMGLDVPPEIVTGLADVNHWTAWQVDESTFTHHAEPTVQTGVDALTVAMLRPALLALGHPPDLVDRVVIWYDPAEVVTRPNRGSDADAAHDRLVISDAAYRTARGFDDGDAPDDDELTRRTALTRGVISDPLMRAILGVLLGQQNVIDQVPELPAGTSSGDPGGPPPADSGQDNGPPPGNESATIAAAVRGKAPARTYEPAVRLAYNLAADRRRDRMSRRLVAVDRDLRARLHTAADDALGRALERAGNRIRSAANRDPELRASVAGQPAHLVAAAVGPDVVTAALGLDALQLVRDTLTGWRDRFDAWTAAGHEEAIDAAIALAGLDRADLATARRIGTLRDRLLAASALGWAWLFDRLSDLAHRLLFDPVLGDQPGEVSGARVPVSYIRAALALAGGRSGGITDAGLPALNAPPLGGIGTGDAIADLLHSSGLGIEEYEWIYGISSRPFEPHRRLDGQRFTGWTDPVLATDAATAWIGPILAPGDHPGCHCDYMPVWADGTAAADQIDHAAATSGDPGKLAELRALALADIAAGRLGTDAIATMVEAERIANSRPSQPAQPTPVTDALADALAGLAAGATPPTTTAGAIPSAARPREGTSR